MRLWNWQHSQFSNILEEMCQLILAISECFRMKLINTRTQVKIQLTSFVNQVFPKLQYYFNLVYHKINN